MNLYVKTSFVTAALSMSDSSFTKFLIVGGAATGAACYTYYKTESKKNNYQNKTLPKR